MKASLATLTIALVAGCGGAATPPPAEVVEAPPTVAPTCVASDPFVPPQPTFREPVEWNRPPLPSFALPDRHDDGALTVRELRVAGDRQLGRELEVRGRVVWIYDCVADLREQDPKLTAAKARKRIAEDPTWCRRPQFEIADDAADGRDRAIRIVEVPRKPNALEKKHLPAEELADETIWRPVPPLAVGDTVAVVGNWTVEAPAGDSDADGLLVYGSLVNETQGWPE